MVVKYTKENTDEKYERAKWVEIDSKAAKKDAQGAEKFVNILTVKWGKRYDANYVNKLYAGIARNTTWKFKFFCFTDDSSGLKE